MSPRTQAQNEAIRRTRKGQILDAARRVFADQGFHGTKMSDIARQAGLSHGSLYHYFQGKDDLFLALLAIWAERLEEVVRGLPDAPSSASEKMWLMNRVALSFLEADQDLLPVIVEFWAYALRSPKASASFRSLFQTMQSSVGEIIREGIAGGEFKPVDVASLSALPLVILDGALLLSLVVGRDLVEPERIITGTQQLIFDGLLAEDEADP